MKPGEYTTDIAYRMHSTHQQEKQQTTTEGHKGSKDTNHTIKALE